MCTRVTFVYALWHTYLGPDPVPRRYLTSQYIANTFVYEVPRYVLQHGFVIPIHGCADRSARYGDRRGVSDDRLA